MRRLTFLATFLVVLAGLVPVAEALPTVIANWYEGAAGYELAVEEARSTQKPMMVYFRTDWCGYCKQFESVLLSSEVVQSYFDEVITVTINPETGNGEAKLALAYQVEAFPAIFIHSADQARVHPIRRTVMSDRGMRLQRPEEFVATLRSAATAVAGR
jgi:thiol:disulfide interchange protein